MLAHEHIILPLDVSTLEKAEELVSLLKSDVGVFKVGLELINSVGLAAISELRKQGATRIFVDAKLHDIPNTVSGAMRAIVRSSGAWCVTVHTMGGSAMLRAAVEAAKCEAEAVSIPRPLVFGVTVLTSISGEELKDDLKVDSAMAEYTTHLAKMAFEAGCDGVIASPEETQTIRAAIPSGSFLIVTPGIRPAGSERGDQARVQTPAEAMARGSNYLVIGRPIYGASDPLAAARSIAREIEESLTPA